MKGGSARKHLIYKHAQKPGWYFDSDFGSQEEAWMSLRSGFVEAFNKAQAGEWNAIDEIAVLEGGQALRSKTLYCYFPDDLLPINSYAHLKQFFQCIRPEEFDTSFGIIRLNRRLLEVLRSIPQFNGWSNWELMAFLYEWADPRESRRIVKIAPGENAMYWEDCLEHGYICVGWDEVGDLSQFESKDEFFIRYEQVFGERYRPAKLREKANEVWTLTELQPGDIVVANQGTSQVLAVGEVVEPGYEFRTDREKYQHMVGFNATTRWSNRATW